MLLISFKSHRLLQQAIGSAVKLVEPAFDTFAYLMSVDHCTAVWSAWFINHNGKTCGLKFPMCVCVCVRFSAYCTTYNFIILTQFPWQSNGNFHFVLTFILYIYICIYFSSLFFLLCSSAQFH